MDTKLYARVGAGAFATVALTMAVLDLRDQPSVLPAEAIAVLEPAGDPLHVQLRTCAAMGELALSAPDCRAAWAEKRRRFLGVEADASRAEPAAPSAIAAPGGRSIPVTEAN